MKIIEPSVEYWEQKDPIEHVCRCAQISYQSVPKEGKEAEKFYNALINSEHLSCLRHESCYYIVTDRWAISFLNDIYVSDNPYMEYMMNAYSLCMYVVTNGNYIQDHYADMHEFEKFRVTPEEFKKVCPELFRPTLHITSSIDITREFNRKSPNNITEESTRYCNYSKDKFNSEISIGNSVAFDYPENETNSDLYPMKVFSTAIEVAEKAYMKLLELGWPSEYARKVLPLCTKSEVVYTYTIKEWSHILKLRLLNKTGRAHPDAVKVAQLIYEELQKLGYELGEDGELNYINK